LLEAIDLDGGDGSLEARLRAAAHRLATPAAEHGLTLLLPTARRCGADRARLTRELSLVTEVDVPPADRVSLLTLHAAKGLEFPVVFIVGCEDGLVPLRWASDQSDHAEERRLFFVGVTRAQQRLILSRAKMRQRNGRLRPMEASPYLDAIEQRLIDHAAPRPARAPDPQLELTL
jgi:DNA helicase-2/ATP-dependent DNA helicase PcrA